MSGCGKGSGCDCGCRHANPRAARKNRRRSTMGAWMNNSATNARFARESTVRGGYATGYYRPLVLPMGSGEMTAPTTHTQVGNFRADGMATGVMALTTVIVLFNLAFYVAAGYGVYKYFQRERS